MTFLDLVIAVLVATGAWSGWRVGSVARGGTWLGLIVGLGASSLLGPRLAERAAGSGDGIALGVLAVVLLLGAVAGQFLGAVVSERISRRRRPARGRRRVAMRTDRAMGAAIGAVGPLALVWVLVPVLAAARVVPTDVLRSSRLASAVRTLLPEPPDVAVAVFGERHAAALVADVARLLHDTSPPDHRVLDDDVRDAVARAVLPVAVELDGGGRRGSAVVLEQDLLVTAAHVVLDARSVTVTVADQHLGARVVFIDVARDVAVLRVDGLDVEPSDLHDTHEGAQGFIAGYPGWSGDGPGALAVSGFRAAPELSISFGRSDPWPARLVAGDVQDGNSGGPLVDDGGGVVGIVLMRVNDQGGIALSSDEVGDVLREARRLSAD